MIQVLLPLIVGISKAQLSNNTNRLNSCPELSNCLLYEASPSVDWSSHTHQQSITKSLGSWSSLGLSHRHGHHTFLLHWICNAAKVFLQGVGHHLILKEALRKETPGELFYPCTKVMSSAAQCREAMQF
jgi:hypothetical protein